ncbi:ATP-binding cassette domain-containing protein [Acutalibacter sp. 1XD8-33]|uniref:ATP-binding cassette domain-containing protein n=1 Tax=Acutalibacter sp. 1XD8-33 TaxID=2320081 RepID=UPI000EA07523|nr:ATP-binding cassette domain-containing protein [Acutalibacter sp. 1XD8-33]RKJ40080.1 ATP-binding cassette domain-containing protein [Acutalibacter sp. 1XD8-33]
MEYVLQTSALGKSYGHFKALENFNIAVPKGAIYGIVGRNGAGKTTLLRLVCGLQTPTYGTYSIYGANNGSLEIIKARRRMGAVVETPSIYLDMSAENNLRQQCRILGLPDFSCVPELLELVGLESAGRKKARNFSLGMRQRLGIAVALCGSPDFLVLDEPVNGLDPQGIVEVRELILKLNQERNITVLISSHILEEMHKLATHYGFIDGGRMVREISAQELEATCRKCVRADVSEPKAVALVLDEMQLEYKILDGRQVDIYDAVNVSKLVRALSERGCEVYNIQNHDESLESYFLSLVGTGKGGDGRD